MPKKNKYPPSSSPVFEISSAIRKETKRKVKYEYEITFQKGHSFSYECDCYWFDDIKGMTNEEVIELTKNRWRSRFGVFRLVDVQFIADLTEEEVKKSNRFEELFVWKPEIRDRMMKQMKRMRFLTELREDHIESKRKSNNCYQWVTTEFIGNQHGMTLEVKYSAKDPHKSSNIYKYSKIVQ